MYSKNEAILDFMEKKKNTKWRKKKIFFFFFQKLNQVNLFQKVETDQPASRLPIQHVYNTVVVDQSVAITDLHCGSQLIFNGEGRVEAAGSFRFCVPS